ncbi:hypothetical protein Tco_0455458 [Tanacetum coccineum]
MNYRSSVLNFERQVKEFKNYTRYSTQGFKDKIFGYLNDIEKGIDARALHKESLQITERVVKERMENERREMMRLEKMIKKDVEYFASRLFFNMDKLEKQLNAEEFNKEIDMVVFKNILIHLMDSIEKAISERGLYKRVHDSGVNERTMQTHEGMISKDASEIDNNVVGTSHDNDNIT